MLINKDGMKKLLLALIAFFVFSSMALAAVNLNTATNEELDGVNGIGPVKAQAIIDYRKKNGPFKNVDELDNVQGFGDKTVEKLRSELTVGAALPAKNIEVEAAVKAVVSPIVIIRHLLFIVVGYSTFTIPHYTLRPNKYSGSHSDNPVRRKSDGVFIGSVKIAACI